MSDIFWSTIAVYTDIACKDILQCLWYMSFILWCNDKTWTNTVAANVLFTILQSCIFCQHINTCFCTCVSCRSKVTATGSHRTDINDRSTLLILLHIRNNTLDSIECTTHITFKNSIPHFKSQLVYTSVFQCNVSSVIYQNIDLSVFLCSISNQLLCCSNICDIHKVVRSFSACCHDLVHNSLSFCFSTSADNNLCSFCCK